MIKLAAILLASSLTLGLKDPPPAIEMPGKPPARHLYLRIAGFNGRFEVTRVILDRYGLHSGDVITVIMARVIAADLGYEYPPELRIILKKLDEQEE
jgi:hypothetical protein